MTNIIKQLETAQNVRKYTFQIEENSSLDEKSEYEYEIVIRVNIQALEDENLNSMMENMKIEKKSELLQC